MIKAINKNTAPYLQLLDIRTKLSESPLVKEMLARATLSAKMHSERFFKDFCVKISESDVRYFDLPKIWGDLDGRWPLLSEKFASRVDIIDETFLGNVKDSYEALAEVYDQAGDAEEYLTDKTFCGTIVIQPKGICLSYRLSFNGCGEPGEDSVLLMLDEWGMILAYISPEVHFVARFIQDAAMDLYGREIDFFSYLVSAFVITDITRDYILFCRFADVRVNQVARPGSREAKRQAGDPDASVNYYPFGIRKIDMRYITTVIRDEEFGVRGHWRMQPYGPGRKQRRLRYISPFVKHGYHRWAGILAAAGTTRGRRAGV